MSRARQPSETTVRAIVAAAYYSHARNRVVNQYTPMVHKIANRLWVVRHNELQGIGTIDDVFQVGIIGLLLAADYFQPDFGVKFITYAYRSVYNHILDAGLEAGVIRVPRNNRMLPEGHPRRVLTDRARVTAELTDNVQITDRKPERASVEDREQVEILLRACTPDQRRVVEMHLGLGSSQRAMAFKEIGEILGFGRQNASNLYKDALRKMRRRVGQEEDPRAAA